MLIAQLLRAVGSCGSRKPALPNQLDGSSYSDRPKSALNRCVIEVFSGVFRVVT